MNKFRNIKISYMHIHIHIDICVYIYLHIYIYIHTYTYIHTENQTGKEIMNKHISIRPEQKISCYQDEVPISDHDYYSSSCTDYDMYHILKTERIVRHLGRFRIV